MLRDLAEDVAMRFLGLPYIWGGCTPMEGFDCSGYVIEILKSVGCLPRGGDWTSGSLYDHFKPYSVKHPYKGCLVFFTNREGKINHVEFCLSAHLAIGASGGNSQTKTKADAIKQSAYVKIRPIISRKGPWYYVDPFMPVEA